MSVDALRAHTDVQRDTPDPALERLLARGPDMCLSSEEESAVRAAALESAVANATKAATP